MNHFISRLLVASALLTSCFAFLPTSHNTNSKVFSRPLLALNANNKGLSVGLKSAPTEVAKEAFEFTILNLSPGESKSLLAVVALGAASVGGILLQAVIAFGPPALPTNPFATTADPSAVVRPLRADVKKAEKPPPPPVVKRERSKVVAR
mmetsp:Transcript_16220/g.33159  ORF Transcript_16220/g.33159 Transcript_16220/m.33159 type:complete len:150 (+) Transcript_16220:59-508(+)